jgi:cell division GTPase FtsZ
MLLGLLNDNIQDVDFAIIFLGLGGITGAGISPTIARILSDLDIPTMVFGVLPAHTGTGADARAQYQNVGYAVEHLRKYTDAFILMDNQRIAYTSNIESAYPHFNQYAAAVISDILSGSDPKAPTQATSRVRTRISISMLPLSSLTSCPDPTRR